MSAYLHFLLEDQSGRLLLEEVLAKYQAEHADRHFTFNIRSYRGIGGLPKGPAAPVYDAPHRQLLNDLPRQLRALEKGFAKQGGMAAVIVLMDLDNRDLREMKRALYALAREHAPGLKVRFCFAIEEMEAWLLGDLKAVQAAYPHADMERLAGYRQDSIGGTWEQLAMALDQRLARELPIKKRSHIDMTYVGRCKCAWAREIGARMTLRDNRSPSFRYFLRAVDGFTDV